MCNMYQAYAQHLTCIISDPHYNFNNRHFVSYLLLHNKQPSNLAV